MDDLGVANTILLILFTVLLLGLAGLVNLFGTQAQPRTVTSSTRRPKMEMRNWGSCHGPQCRLMSERCNLDYCGVCCAAVHKNLPLHIMAPSLTGHLQSSTLPVLVKKCLCEGKVVASDTSYYVEHFPYGCFQTKTCPGNRNTFTPEPSWVRGDKEIKKATLVEVKDDEGLWPLWYANKMKGFQVYGPKPTVTVVDLSDYNW